jgi:dATP/dGTP diphosphohydrolase
VSDFTIKDSGARQAFEGGMVRDIADDKIDYTLITDGPMFKRWAIHLTNGAKKYAKRNWMKAQGGEEYQRFKESAFRHFMQWYYDDRDEDHASAVYFNINGAEHLRDKVNQS